MPPAPTMPMTEEFAEINVDLVGGEADQARDDLTSDRKVDHLP